MASTGFNLEERADVVVIGGGVIGLSVARALAQKRVGTVLILERGQLGREASFAAAGMLAPQAEANSDDAFFRLCCRSRDLYPTFAAHLLEETGIDVELDRTGTLYCALNEHDHAEIDKRFAWQHRVGLSVEQLTPGEARQLEPNLAHNLLGALKFPLDSQVENRRLLSALIAANEKLGVKYRANTTVESLRVERGVVAGVTTSAGFLSTRNVVCASGAWTSLIKIENAEPQIRIEPVRGQMLCFDAKPALARHVIYSPRGYLVPRRDGRLLAGSTTEQAGFAKVVTTQGRESIRSHAVEIVPGIATLPLVDSWAGLRPRAPDNLPVLGKSSETDGLFFAAGHYRNGILLAPLTGELLAGLIADNVVAEELHTFAPDRFTAIGVN
ncbi:MAG TPA: glycine oxidase ThiO [Pyrinomonadaceae bacterium]|nr:glycine oxidase ThiO [Pyrinomonadaceae bacterium]